MKMTRSKSFVVTIVGLVIVAGYLRYRWNEMVNVPPEMAVLPAHHAAHELVHHQSNAPTVTTNSPAPLQSSNKAPHDLGFRQKANEFSDAEKVEMTNLFVAKLKPAPEKWASVYGDHVPFSLADLTMDKFVERFGRDSQIYHSYTFVMGDITLSIVEQNGDTAVRYLASKHGLKTMETMPPNGAAPDCGFRRIRTPVPIHFGQSSGIFGQLSERSDALL